MKKVISIILCSCLIGICMTCVSYAVDSEKACTNQEIVWKDVGNKSVHLSNDIMYDVGFYVSEPFKKEENASESYKKAKLVGKFYSNGKNNYCKTVDNKTYKIRSKLYEIENIDDSFIRISKKCIVNVNFVKCFDMGETGKIIVKLYDDTEEKVSRRRIKDVLKFLEDKSL